MLQFGRLHQNTLWSLWLFRPKYPLLYTLAMARLIGAWFVKHYPFVVKCHCLSRLETPIEIHYMYRANSSNWVSHQLCYKNKHNVITFHGADKYSSATVVKVSVIRDHGVKDYCRFRTISRRTSHISGETNGVVVVVRQFCNIRWYFFNCLSQQLEIS